MIESRRTQADPMRIGLMGFGRAGRAVTTLLLERSDVTLEWVVRRSARRDQRCAGSLLGIESHSPARLLATDCTRAAELFDRYPVDAIIDFSSTTGIDYYGAEAAARGISIVCAVSAFDDAALSRLESWSRSTRVLWSPNITIGINFMLLAAKTLQAIAPWADIAIVEEHFRAKAEVSGTAVRLASGLGQEPSDIKTVRAGGIIGTHEVLFGFPYQTVRLRHESLAREAFGDGALFAAQHLVGLANGLYRMEDILLPYFTQDPAPRPDAVAVSVGG